MTSLNTVLYIHGKNGKADEANHYQKIFPDCNIVGLDYHGQTPWETKDEILTAYLNLAAKHKSIILIANSIGAYFAMNALSGTAVRRAFFISPIVNMEKLITDMMLMSNVSETELMIKKEIATPLGETLSWDYLCYVRQHPIVWNVPTDILYGAKDNLTSFDTISAFAEQHNTTLTVMTDGEHWFHSTKQMDFLNCWLQQCLKK